MDHPERPPSRRDMEESFATESETLWKAKAAEIEKRTDALDSPIDRRIKDPVIALNLLGIPTAASCEGHAMHGSAAPWIEIAAPGEPEQRYINEKQIFQIIANKYGIKYEDLRRGSPDAAWAEASYEASRNDETPEYKQWREANQDIAQKLVAILKQFYSDREAPPDVQIILTINEWGTHTMHNKGEDYKNNTEQLSSEERLERLKRLRHYQSEFHNFTEFLRKHYLGLK
jgi:hypothetical protein